MKKIRLILIFILFLIIIENISFATPNDELIETLTKKYTIAGEEVGMYESDKVKIERYLQIYPATEEQKNQIIKLFNDGIKMMEEENVSNPIKLSKESKERAMNLAKEAGKILELNISFDLDKNMMKVYKNGKFLDTLSINAKDKLVYTGNNYFTYINVGVILVASITLLLKLVKK